MNSKQKPLTKQNIMIALRLYASFLLSWIIIIIRIILSCVFLIWSFLESLICLTKLDQKVAGGLLYQKWT